jgi:hypothetical protein
MHEIAAKKGEFTFFGLFLPENAIFCRWDLVISAPWLDVDELEDIGEFHELVVASLGKAAMREISCLVPLSPNDPNLRAVISEYPVDDGEIRVRCAYLFGLKIEDAIILQARRPPRKVRAKPRRRSARAA